MTGYSVEITCPAQRRRDDETARLLLAVLWRLKAHLHGETPLTGSNDR